MIDVGSYDGASGCHLFADKFRSYMAFYAFGGAFGILSDCHILHFWSHNTLAGIIHLSDAMAFFGATGTVGHRESYRVEFAAIAPHTAVVARDVRQFLCIFTVQHPLHPVAG